MTLAELVDALGLVVRSGSGNLEREVTGAYAGDLLSDVIARGREGNVWITLQTHLNVVAVANMKDLAGIILVNGREPEEDMAEKAEAEQIPVMVSRLPTFEVAGRLHQLGIRGEVPEEASGTGKK